MRTASLKLCTLSWSGRVYDPGGAGCVQSAPTTLCILIWSGKVYDLMEPPLSTRPVDGLVALGHQGWLAVRMR